MLTESAFPEAADAGEQPSLPGGGRAYQRVNDALGGRLLAKTRNASAPRRRQGEIVKVMWEWAPGRITALVRACIELGHHPREW